MGICVYSILHRASGKFYVGKSCKTEARFCSHKNMLRRGSHHCIHLQRAWNVYGESEFEFIRLQSFSTDAEAIIAEQKLLDKFFPMGVLFNSAKSNKPSDVIKLANSAKAREKLSTTRSKAPHLLEQLSNARRNAFTPEAIAKRVTNTKNNGAACAGLRMPVRAVNHETGERLRFISAAEAARITGFSSGNISSCCNGKRKMVNGFVFTYEWMLGESDPKKTPK